MKNLILVFVLFVFFTSCTQELIENNNIPTKLAVDNQYIKKTLLSYDVVSFKKIQHFSGDQPYWSGTAMCCDGLGICDSIIFTSRWEPKIGKARFQLTYDAYGQPSGWDLVNQ